MKKLFVVTLFLAAGAAQAFPPFTSRPFGVSNPDPACTNFAGTYQGFCTIDGVKEEQTFKLEQWGCEAIRCHGMAIPIGSMISMSGASPTYGTQGASSYSKTATFAWDADKKSLLVQGGMLAQTLGPTEKLAEPLALAGSIKLDGDKLLILVKSKSSTGEKDFALCEYTKTVTP